MRKKNKLVYGVGINDANYQVFNHEIVNGHRKQLWFCPYYRKWKGMLERCYSKKRLERCPIYEGCSVYDEWKYFSNFRKWMEKQEWVGRSLDKDFLIEGNKIYSPSTCVFVPDKVNLFITTNGKDRGDYPLGVSLFKTLYRGDCKGGGGKGVYLGLFLSPKQAHQAWLLKKLEVCNEYLLEFKDEPIIKQGLTRIRDKIKYHIDTKTELTSF